MIGCESQVRGLQLRALGEITVLADIGFAQRALGEDHGILEHEGLEVCASEPAAYPRLHVQSRHARRHNGLRAAAPDDQGVGADHPVDVLILLGCDLEVEGVSLAVDGARYGDLLGLWDQGIRPVARILDLPEFFDIDLTRQVLILVEEVNRLQGEANHAIEQLGTGETKNIHETMIALEKAEVSFKLMLEVRNKILDAYHEVMRMNV